MAVYAVNGTLTASTVDPITLTSWKKFVIITVGASPSGTVYATTNGSTPTVGGNDCYPIASGTTVAIRNQNPAPELSTTVPGALDPAAVPAFTTAQTLVNLISSAACVFTVELSSTAGAATVVG